MCCFLLEGHSADLSGPSGETLAGVLPNTYLMVQCSPASEARRPGLGRRDDCVALSRSRNLTGGRAGTLGGAARLLGLLERPNPDDEPGYHQ